MYVYAMHLASSLPQYRHYILDPFLIFVCCLGVCVCVYVCFSSSFHSNQAAAQQKQQNAKKDEKWNSIWMWGNEQSMGNPSGNASMPSGNGNANCFWEDPAAAPKVSVVTSSKGQTNIQQNGTGKALAKSQTVSNMQSVANSPKTNANASKSSSATISKTSSSGNVTAIVNSTSNNNNKKAKGGNSNAKKGKRSELIWISEEKWWKLAGVDRSY